MRHSLLKASLIAGLLATTGACAPKGGSSVKTQTAAPPRPPANLPSPAAPISPTASVNAQAASEKPAAPVHPIAPLPPAAKIDAKKDCARADAYSEIHAREEVYQGRYGSSATHYSQLQTTLQRPLEECGLQSALEHLSQLACDNETQPFATLESAHNARKGSMGSGGRCASIVDVYEIVCPESRYLIHVDMYFCGPSLP